MNRTQVSRAAGRAAVIRPACPADLSALAGFFEGLSVQTRYLRFFGPVRPTPALLNLLSGQPAGVHAVVAVADGVIVGHAMAVDPPPPGDGQGPGQDRATDIGVVVADAWQGRGVGSALMRALVGQAEARGVASLTMDVMHANRQVLGMILGHWPAADIDHSRDSLSIRIPLMPYQPERPPAPPAATQVPALVTLGGSIRDHEHRTRRRRDRRVAT
jgi:ribosomal protein S18 acetylase RimI-like enzyme